MENYQFIASEQGVTETKLARRCAGESGSPRRKHYCRIDIRLKSIVDDFAKRELMDYVRGIAFNLTY